MLKTKPRLVIVGGPNGSGKTTFATEFLSHENFIYLSADAIAYELDAKNPTAQAIQAGRLFTQRLIKHLSEKKDLIIESTLSGLSLKKHIEAAKALDYQIDLTYIFLDSPELCNARIEERVKKGGHFVPPEDVERRFYRSLAHFWDTYKNSASRWHVYYNFNTRFEPVAFGSGPDTEIIFEEFFNRFLTIKSKGTR